MEETECAGRKSAGIDIGDLQLADLIDAKGLQALIDDFYSLAHLPITITDMEGRVLVGAGWQDICTLFHRVQPETRRHCVESDTHLTVGIPAGEFRIYRCKNHMVDIATPIIVGGRHFGNVFSGQFFFVDEPPDRELFRSQARRYGFEEEHYLSALDAVPRLERKTVETGIHFFLKLAYMVSQLGYTNFNQKRSLAERLALSTSLREREELLESICEGTPDAIFAKDRHGRWVMANSATLRILGKTLEAVLGRTDSEIVADQKCAFFLTEADRRILESGRAEEVEEVIRTPEGPRVFLSSKAPRLDAEGNIIGTIGVARDITERKWAEKASKAARHAAEEASRAKSEFLANMSHEIRTPMTVFMAAVEHLLEIDRDPTRRQLLTLADKSAQHLQTVIEDILDFSRIEAGRVDLEEKPFDLRACVRDVMEMMEIKAREKNLRLDAAISPHIPDVVSGDPNRLGQVLLNLVGNAIKFTPQGEVRVSVDPRDGFLAFSISDTGIGIPEGKRHLLFKSFSQMDSSSTRKFGGTGLGLAISSGLIELMGGEIGVESTEGKGSVFTFTIPLRKRRTPHGEVAGEQKTPWSTKGSDALILLAEDDPAIRQMLQMSLARRGWRTETAETGREAIGKWERGGIDVIIMDLQMPEMDGLEATRRIRQAEGKAGKRTAIIGLTAHARREDKEECLEAGMDQVLIKPVHLEGLYSAIESRLATAPRRVSSSG